MTTNLLSVIEQQHKALERMHLWADSQADAQSKGGHATFDLMQLREERDALIPAIAAGQQALETQGEVEPAVAWFVFADSNGPVPLELYGWDEKACKYAVLMNARSVGWKGTVAGYLLEQNWTIKPVYTHPQATEPAQSSNQPAKHSESSLLDSEPAPLSHLKTETGAPPEQGAITSVNGSEPAPSTAWERAQVVEDLLMYAGDNGYSHIDYADTMRHAAALLQSTADHIPDAGKMGATPKIGCVQHDCAECQARAALPAGELIHPTPEMQLAGGDVRLDNGIGHALHPIGWLTAARVWIAMEKVRLAATRSQPTTEESLVVAGAKPVQEPLTDAQWDELAALTGCESFTQIGKVAISRILGITKKGEQ